MSEARARYKARRGVYDAVALPSHAEAPETPQKPVQRASRTFQMDLLDGRRKKRNPAIRTPEHREQICLMQWAALSQGAHPELALLMHIPNGEYRAKATAARLKAMGTKAGVPDLYLPVARGPWHGLWIEMKGTDRARCKPSPEQRWWIEKLQDENYQAVVCHGWEAARDALINYLQFE